MENWRGNSQRFTKEKFIIISNEIHSNKYNYDNVVYKNTDTKICIICPIHGEFWQTPYMHTRRKHGCPICGKEKSIKTTIERNKNKEHKKPTLKMEQFIKKSKEIHGNKYDYSKVICINSKTKVCIICPIHGEFWQIPTNHYINGSGCPACRESKGEKIIRNWLEKNNINFEIQKTFDDCKGKIKKLMFDFYLPDYNLLIEYDGEQHFKKRGFITEENFLKTKINDYKKDKYCNDKNIKLLRINYLDNIEHKLEALKLE